MEMDLISAAVEVNGFAEISAVTQETNFVEISTFEIPLTFPIA